MGEKEEDKPTIKMVGKIKKEPRKVFKVTIKTTFQLRDKDLEIDSDMNSEKEVLNCELVLEGEEFTKDALETIGMDARKFNNRQEFYAKDSKTQSGDIQFMYISSRDPRDNREQPEKS